MSNSSYVTKAVAAVLLIAGFAYAVHRFSAAVPAEQTEQLAAAPAAETTEITIREAPARRKASLPPAERTPRASEPDATTTGTPAPRRPSPPIVSPTPRRTASADLVTTNAQLVIEDGETSGRIYFDIYVVDEADLPVSGATVEMTGLRTRLESASWYAWRGVPVKEQTDEKGIARVSAPQYTSEMLDTGAVGFNVTHPDYSPTSVDVHLDKMTKVILKAGWKFNMVVSDETSSEPLKSGIELHFHSRFKPDWSQQKNGTITVRKIDDKELKFYVTHEATGGAKAISALQVVPTSFPPDETLYVTVMAASDVYGRLGDNVPRPVVNGRVEAFHTSGDRSCGTYARQQVDIAADGTFVLKDMPKGEIQIWALANGWCSQLPKADSSMGAPQKFILTENGQQYMLPMVQTATAVFKLVDENGHPVEGARLATNPNMCYENCCGMWIRSIEFQAVSTGDGLAAIADIPPLARTRFGVHGNYELPPQERGDMFTRLDRSITFDLAPGQVLEQTLTVYPKGATIIKQEGDKITSGTAQ